MMFSRFFKFFNKKFTLERGAFKILGILRAKRKETEEKIKTPTVGIIWKAGYCFKFLKWLKYISWETKRLLGLVKTKLQECMLFPLSHPTQTHLFGKGVNMIHQIAFTCIVLRI